jgi:phosphonate transport system substrate-binding protein
MPDAVLAILMRGTMNARALFLSALVFLGLAGANVALAAPCPLDRPVSVGIVPQQAPSDLARMWMPILKQVSAGSGCDFRFATAPTIPEFERRLQRSEYDIAYMNPYHYTVFHQAPGYQAFAREQGRRLRGLLVSLRDGGPTSEQALNGQQVAFPSPAAFAATVIPMAELEKAGIHIKPVFVASHDSVYLNVARGFYPAGGGIERTFEALSPDVKDKLQIIWRSRDYPPHAFAALPTLDPQIRQAFVDGFNALAGNPEGKKLLEALQFKGLEAARDADWDTIRALNINLIKPLVEPATPHPN